MSEGEGLIFVPLATPNCCHSGLGGGWRQIGTFSIIKIKVTESEPLKEPKGLPLLLHLALGVSLQGTRTSAKGYVERGAWIM